MVEFDFTPQMLICWATLIVTVIGLLIAFWYTNRTAFPEN